ncbi:MAG TPA: Flp family type IVb pilin [Sphingomicrobium sp.]|nr:Flp family type IVb pilin [Sphingomicrobium sp.]
MVEGLRALLRDGSGASAAEYAVILAIVGTGIILAAIFLGEAVTGALSDASGCIGSDGSNC